MPLAPFTPPRHRMHDSRASRVVLEANTSSQADETGLQVSGPREVHQEGEIDHAQHWGFSSRPAQGTELIQILDEYGRVVVAERVPCPVSIADGDTCIWTSATSYVKINAAGAIWVRSKAAQLVHLGDGTTTEYPVAYSGVKETEASAVACGAALNQKTVDITADLTVLRNSCIAAITKINLAGKHLAAIDVWATAAGYPGIGGVHFTDVEVTSPAALTTTAMATSTNHSYVSSGSAHVKVDV